MRHSSNLGLARVLPSAAGAVGIPGFHDDLGIGSATVAIVCLIDGLGAVAIEEHADVFDALTDAEGGSIEAAFPTTTPTGLATLGTGLMPGEHGIVGASFWLPEDGRILSPLHWGRQPTPEAVQPEATVFERVERTGVRAITIAPKAYARSGLTAAVLRGSSYRCADTAGERAAAIHDICTDGRPTVAYVYWAALDRAAHEFGTRSAEWRNAASEVNAFVWQLRAELGAHSALIVTADHGMIDCGQRLWIEDLPPLVHGVRAIAGEPRMRHIYSHADHDPSDVARRWRDVLGDGAVVLLRDEALEAGLFGPVDPGLEDRIGDVLAIAQSSTIMASRQFDERVSRLVGHHGALTDEERRIPGLIVRA